MNQVETKPAEEKLASEARVLPLGLARRLGNVARFLFSGERFGLLGHFRLRKRIVPIIEMAAKENH